MQTILLDEQQASLVSEAYESVQVRNQAGAVLGHILRRTSDRVSFDQDSWIECWDEWYFETDEPAETS